MIKRKLPFKTFDEMNDAMDDGRIFPPTCTVGWTEREGPYYQVSLMRYIWWRVRLLFHPMKHWWRYDDRSNKRWCMICGRTEIDTYAGWGEIDPKTGFFK